MWLYRNFSWGISIMGLMTSRQGIGFCKSYCAQLAICWQQMDSNRGTFLNQSWIAKLKTKQYGYYLALKTRLTVNLHIPAILKHKNLDYVHQNVGGRLTHLWDDIFQNGYQWEHQPPTHNSEAKIKAKIIIWWVIRLISALYSTKNSSIYLKYPSCR